MKIELSGEQIDKIIVKELKTLLKRVDNYPSFSYNEDVEEHYVRGLKKAINIVIAYYSVGGKVEELIDE